MSNLEDKADAINWVAIDIGKHAHMVLVENAQGKQSKFKIINCGKDYDKFVSFLKNLSGKTKIALEPTGNFHRTLGHRLLDEGLELVSVSSVAGARYREAMYNSWDKNDPKDTTVILSLLKHGLTQYYHEPVITGCHHLQEIAKTYYQISMARKRLADSLLNHYLPLYFPEMDRFWQSTRTEWFINFLLAFPTPHIITRLTEQEFITSAIKVVGRKVHKLRVLSELYLLAKHSTALPIQEESLAIKTFKLQLERFKALAEQRALLENIAHEELKDREDYRYLCSIPGIGPILGLIILAETGDIKRFNHHRQYLKYCGMDLAKCQSGTFRGKESLSKRGNARLRYAFWMAARGAIQRNENTFRDKYQRYVQKIPADADLKRKAMTAVAAKMVRVAYGILKHKQVYQPYFEQRLPSGSIPLVWAVEAN